MKRSVSSLVLLAVLAFLAASPVLADKSYGIPSAMQTAQAKTPTRVPTEKPTSTATNTPTPRPKYPPIVQALVNADSPTECDAFAYAIPYGESAPIDFHIQANQTKYLACDDALGVAINAWCFVIPSSNYPMFSQPATGNMWVACGIDFLNLGIDTQFVSPMDFSIVSASNTKYDYTVAPFVEDPSKAFVGSDIPSGENESFEIAFEVPLSVDRPCRLHYEPIVAFGQHATFDILVTDI